MATVDKILDLAHHLLINRGYNGFSYADIAEAASISKPSIHHHFPTKADLGVAVVRRYREQIQAVQAAAQQAGMNPKELLQAYIGHWRQCIAEQEAPFCVCAMLAAELPSLPDTIRAEVQTHFQDQGAWLTAVLRAGGADGSLPPQADPAQQAEQILALVHGGMLSARALNNPAVFEKLAQQLLNTLG